MDAMAFFPEPDIIHRPHLEAMAAPQSKALSPHIQDVRMSLDDVFVKKTRIFSKRKSWLPPLSLTIFLKSRSF